jgi:hypothetical protein
MNRGWVAVGGEGTEEGQLMQGVVGEQALSLFDRGREKASDRFLERLESVDTEDTVSLVAPLVLLLHGRQRDAADGDSVRRASE